MKNPLPKRRIELEHGCDLYEEGEYQQAFLAFHRAAKLGDPQAQVNLANMYDAGEGVTQNRQSAIHWYKLAIKKGVPEGAYNLAVTYRQQGKIKWARYWFQRASEMGDEDALGELDALNEAK